jgi:hypothetical protein
MMDFWGNHPCLADDGESATDDGFGGVDDTVDGVDDHIYEED